MRYLAAHADYPARNIQMMGLIQVSIVNGGTKQIKKPLEQDHGKRTDISQCRC